MKTARPLLTAGTFLRSGIAILLALAAAAPLTAAVGRWSPVGPEGGGPQVVAAAPSSAPRLYAAFPWGSGSLETLVMRSDDGGTSWQESNGGLEGERIIALAVDPRDADRAFAVAAIQGCFSDDPGGVYRTEDAGAHWELAATSEEVGGLACGAGLLVLPDAVLVGTQSGVARSSDGGATWQVIPLISAADDVHTLLRDPRDEDVLYAAGWQARFKSTDGGVSWTRLDDPAPALAQWVIGLAISPSDPDTLYEYGAGHSLWRSHDGGATWSEPVDAPEADNIYGVPLRVDPHDPDTLFLGTAEGLWVSHDGGATFEPVHGGLPDLEPEDTKYYGVTALEVDAAGRILLAAPLGLWISPDAGQHWSAAALHGVHANEIRFLRFDPFDARRFLFTSFDTLYETRDGGTTFSPLPLPEPGLLEAIEFDPFRRGRLVALTAERDEDLAPIFRIFVSTDGGHHWGPPSLAPFDASALAIPAPNVLLVTAGNRIYRREGGGPWRRVAQGEPADPSNGFFTFEGIVVDPYRKDTLFALGLDHTLHGGVAEILYRSLDGGRKWSPWRVGSTRGLAFDPLRPDIVYLARGADIFQYPIVGAGARKIGRITPADAPTVLLVDRSDPDTFFAATFGSGVLVSPDRARHWSMLAPGLPLGGHILVTDLEQDRANPRRLYATPATGGLWRVDRER